MQISDLIDSDTERQLKALLDERLALLEQDQGKSLNEWNDAIDSARRMVAKS